MIPLQIVFCNNKLTSMKPQDLLNEILAILQTVRENKEELQKIHRFMMEEIYIEPEKEEYEIPEKYKDVVPKIADSLSAGLTCFLNTDTLEIEDVPDNMLMDPEEYELMTEDSTDEFELKYLSWDKCIRFDPPESHESFKIMEQFAEDMQDRNMQQKLFNVLSRRKPFVGFKYLIDNSPYRQDWFGFKQKKLEEYVSMLLEPEMDDSQ